MANIRYVGDFETASACSLKEAGAARYAEHPTTEILCLVFKSELTGQRIVWTPGRPLDELMALVNDPSVVFVSHASFEQYIWRSIMAPQYGLPPLPPERWEDTQAVCAWVSWPLKLEKALQIGELPVKKDMEGNRLTLSLSRARKDGSYDRSPATLERVIAYCSTDVDGEEVLDRRLGPLSEAELRIWRMTERMNQRGIKLDLDYVHAMKRIVTDAAVPLLKEFHKLTGDINPGQRDKLIAWCGAHGLELENLQKKYLSEVLGEDEETTDAASGIPSFAAEDDMPSVAQRPGGRQFVPEETRRVLDIRSVLGSASIKKIDRMLACVCSDGRARGLQQYHAAGTGRFGGRLLQPHNFPWDKEGTLHEFSVDDVVETIRSGDYRIVEHRFQCDAITAVGLSLRNALIPADGHVFEEGDYSTIEARILLALAGQHDKTALMAAGGDAYLDCAETIYGDPPGSLDKKKDAGKRDTGKKGVLSCGFQIGPENLAAKYCRGDVEIARLIVNTYRNVWAPKVPELWAAFKEACYALVQHGVESKIYGCYFHMVDEWMVIDLPSGWQRLWYYRPHMQDRLGWGWSPAYWTMKSGQWKRVYLYGGLLVENVVQALARGLLCSAMGRLEEREGRPLVLTVHDEILAEMPADRVDLSLFKRVMAEPPDWAVRMGIPIAVDCPDEPWLRYQK